MRGYSALPKVVNFIERLHNGEIYVSDMARTMTFQKPFQTTALQNLISPPPNLADILSNAVNSFELNPTPENIDSCLYWINRAYFLGVIKEGSGLLTKLRDKEQKVFDLQAEIDRLKEDVDKPNEWKEKYEQ